MKNLLLIALGFMVSMGISKAQDQGLPPNPEPGKCYIKCITKDEFKEESVQVMTKAAYSKLTIVPATYKTVTERVLVKEESKKYTYVPAVYETVEVDFVKKEGRTDLTIVDAKFGSDSRTIEVYPQTAGWEYTTLEDCPYPNKENCQALCWKEYPSQSTTLALTTVVADAATNDVPVNRINDSYTKQVIKTPARMEEEIIPAVYDEITKEVLVTPASYTSVKVPAVYETVTKTVLVKQGGLTVWEEVDCKLTEYSILPILYDYNSAALTANARKIIDETILDLMKDKANISVEIASHTDARGNDDYNMDLSQRRAESVVNYLASKGINRNRLIAKGFGETRLKNRCSNGVDCSESEHHANRRTEFRVLGN
ncbi:OmpA family protein [Membranihabitans marinus]|uniref:OmpA family protein n=1 Tax=Membranihabitans marinus TaxID=1227546 RepID=UPI001F196418|nr:OmpA family protein [Membranihabitans marinus]